MTARWLVLGASGQVGYFLLQRLAASGDDVVALSRSAAPGWAQRFERVRWVTGDLFRGAALPEAHTVLSAGPLDGFASWLERADPPAPARIVALSSTSVQTKRLSPDPNERALVARLKLAEETLHAWCARRGVAWTVLRPTLVYGCGLDRSLTPIARRARALGWFPLPRAAVGLRQPVHADDVAAACIAASTSAQSAGRTYAVPGAETLSFGAMIERTLDCLEPKPRTREVPAALLAPALALAGGLARFGVKRAAALARLREDLAFDAAPAQRDFGYAPRVFAPTAQMFESPG